MKLIISLILMYSFIGVIITSTFSTNTSIGLCSVVFYVLFSITYFRKTFVPFLLNWFGNIINDHYLMEKFKQDESFKGYLGLIGNLYVSSQNKDSQFPYYVKKFSYLSFLVLPALFYAHYSLYIQLKSMKNK